MSPKTETKASVGFNAGVKDYRLTYYTLEYQTTKASAGFNAGVKDYRLTYYTLEYQTKDTDILVAFQVTQSL